MADDLPSDDDEKARVQIIHLTSEMDPDLLYPVSDTQNLMKTDPDPGQ